MSKADCCDEGRADQRVELCGDDLAEICAEFSASIGRELDPEKLEFVADLSGSVVGLRHNGLPLLSKHVITVNIQHGSDKKTYRFNMHKIPSFTSLWLVMAGGFETLADYFRSLTDEQLEEALNTHAGRLYPMPSTRHSRAQMHIALAEAQRRSLAPIKSMDFICGEAA